jgi:hypothetical protein
MKLIKEIYLYKWPKDGRRYATLGKTCDKIEVSYHCLNKIYDQDDWQFLHDLSEEALKMYQPEKYEFHDGGKVKIKTNKDGIEKLKSSSKEWQAQCPSFWSEDK